MGTSWTTSLLGAAHARRRTLAAGILSSARSVLLRSAIVASRSNKRRLPGTGSPSLAVRWFAVRWFAVRWFAVRWFAVRWFAVRWFAMHRALPCYSTRQAAGRRHAQKPVSLVDAGRRHSDRELNSQVPPASSMPPTRCVAAGITAKPSMPPTRCVAARITAVPEKTEPRARQCRGSLGLP